MPLGTESTTFTRDVFGRYVCNTLQEALDSATGGGKAFDVIIIGGGSFGGVLANRLFQLDKRMQRHRTLVLEGGPLLLTEHVQNLPQMGEAMKEVMHRPWTSPPELGLNFPGLAVCLAGRSLFWGGWSPQLTDGELTDWPQALVLDLKAAYFAEAKRQIGTDTPNDFIFGPLHDMLRNRLFAGIGNVQHRLGINTAADLEAPLAVISSAQRAGTYPTNKFSAIQLLMDSARRAWEEHKDDAKKRLMIVPNCTVRELVVTGGKVTAIRTSMGDIGVPANGAVVLALGTIESARLALVSNFPNPHGLIGCNLMGHLRSNFTFRFPRKNLGIPADRLYASALFVKGKSPHGFFHLQITASAAGMNATDSEAELFKKIPNIDQLDQFDFDDEFVIITLRGIGEMVSQRQENSGNRVELVASAPAGQGVLPRLANVRLQAVQQDNDLWKHMDEATDQVANVLAGNQPYQIRIGNNWHDVNPAQAGQGAADVFPHLNRHDNLGTTHHEAGPLWMGDDPTKSVTDRWGRFHEVQNAWVAGPALFPTVGSPNPMLTGVALARRTAERMFEAPFAEPFGTQIQLFNGSNLNGWTQCGPGIFSVQNGELVTQGGMGMLWYSALQFRDFELVVEWRVNQQSDNSGIFVRFPEPVSLQFPAGDPWIAINEGYEIQIDDDGAPSGNIIHKTGAIYGIQAPSTVASNPPGQWNTFVISVIGQTYNVTLNGQQVITNFVGNRSNRGHVGLQNHLPKDQVFFRKVAVTPL